MTQSLNIAAYGEGVMYPPALATNMDAIKNAGWTSVILSLFHIDSYGAIIFNDTLIIPDGNYIGDAKWPGQLDQLLQGGTITTLLASVGGGGVTDFHNIQTIYQNNNNSFVGTHLETNFQVFKHTFPSISLIDMDCEDNYDQASFVAFCNMLVEIGFGITFCPYKSAEMVFWANSLAEIHQAHPTAVKWWNLQCYDGGYGNDPDDWAEAINGTIPGFNTNGFILAGDWSRFWDSTQNTWEGNCPAAVSALMSTFRDEASVGGGFIWTIDQIIDYASMTNEHPDPNSCGNVNMATYVNAIATSL